jgi:hypothetical protein
MISTIASGLYTLGQSHHGVKLLQLHGETFAWVTVPRIGGLLVHTTQPHVLHERLSRGRYRLYNVVDEPRFSDQLHLELEYGTNAWQGYVLPSGLPTRHVTRRRIVPTQELITSRTRTYANHLIQSEIL